MPETKSVKPNKELLQKWADELRSGKHEQGRLVMKDGNKFFCCIGVACELVGVETSEENYNVFNSHYGLEWFNGHVQFTTLNDKLGKNFNEIADYIEEMYLGTRKESQ